MPALTQECKNFDLSYSYDTLTFYTKFSDSSDDPQDPMLVAIKECNQLSVASTPGKSKESKIANEIAQTPGYQRSVHANDDDHNLYHRDHFDGEHKHYHIKFRNILSRKQLVEVLQIFIKNKLLTEIEKTNFLAAFDKRYSDARNNLSARLTNNKESDTTAIIKFIKGCKDNDVLVNLQRYLLNGRFDYLRQLTGFFKSTSWQGTNRDGQIVLGSKSWAMIEKSFELQMEHNIKSTCHFTPALAIERAEQMRCAHRFFAIKRQVESFSFTTTNDEYELFHDYQVRQFDVEYSNHFGNYR